MWVSLHKFYTLQASTMDLGDFEQEFWKITHGDWWAFSTVFQTPAFANDGSVFIYPLAYGFRFLGGASFLFGLQALGTAWAAWGIYRAAILNHLAEWTASILAILFLLYPAILGGSQFDFHPDFLALPLLVWAYVYYTTDRKGGYYILLALAAVAKNMALISIAGWGLGLLVYRKRWRDGLITVASSVGLFFLEMDVIFPRYFQGGTEKINLALYGYLGHGFSGILLGIVTHFPAVVHHLLQEGPYAFWILEPVLGLSLLGSASVPALLSLVALNALSAFPAQQQINDQYQVILAGWAFLALGEALARFRAQQPRLLFGVAVATVMIEALFVGSVILPELAATNRTLPAVEAAVQHIPRHAVVWTQNRLGPWAYRFRVLGIAREQAPHQFIDPLPLLWREADRGGVRPTAILAERPVTPYMADIIAESLRAGYRVTEHQGGVFVVQGMRHFGASRPSAVGNGWQPRSSVWEIPAWTQQTMLGHVDWPDLAVVVPPHARGVVFPGFPVVLRPGTYVRLAGTEACR
nr:DUF2079 domain-containing protein [Sulfobacillus harzensis]